MSHLRIVPKTAPTPKEEVVQRVKAMPKRVDGIVQCNRCGGRTVMTTVNGSVVENGKYKAGTVIEDRVCYDCHLKGIFTPMVPTLKRIE